MKCFRIDLNELPKISLLGRETLIPPQRHLSRQLEEYALYIVTKGNMKLLVNEQPWTLNAGDVCMFSKGDWQQSETESFCEYHYVHFHFDRIETLELNEKEYADWMNSKRILCMHTSVFSLKCYDFFHILLQQRIHISDAALLKHIVDVLQSNILSAECREPLKRYQLSSAVASLLLELESNSIPRKNTSEMKLEKTYDIANRIAEYVEQHYTEAITGEMIEQQFYLSFDHANRMFRKVMGTTVVKYRNIVRIQNAKAKMRVTNMPIKEIALEVGFDNVHYFSRVFRQHEGISPSNYRRMFMKI